MTLSDIEKTLEKKRESAKIPKIPCKDGAHQEACVKIEQSAAETPTPSLLSRRGISILGLKLPSLTRQTEQAAESVRSFRAGVNESP